MVGYIVRRLLLAVPLLFLVTAATFIAVALIPGDPAVRILGSGHTLAQYRALDRKLGLQRPIYEQYWHWLVRAFHGSLGTSLFSLQPVTSAIGQRIWVTVWLVTGATVVSVIVGIGLGAASVVLRGPLRAAVDILSWVGFAFPSFWLALILVDLFAVQGHVLPATGYVPFSQSPLHWFESLALPVITLSAVGATGIAKQTRDAMSEVMGSEFVTSLRLSGLSERTIVLRHVLRNAAIPVVTSAGLFAVAMLGGTVLVEQVFVLPGLGSLAVQAAADHDLPVIEGVVVVFTLIVVVVNLLVDFSYAWLNPRVRAAA